MLPKIIEPPSPSAGGFLESFHHSLFAVLFGSLHLLLQGLLFDQYHLAFAVQFSNPTANGAGN
jgi:hypothetical protein